MKVLNNNLAAKVESESKNVLHENFGFNYLLNMIDIYGKPVNFSVGKKREKVTTVIGGVLTVIFVLCVLSYMVAETVKMHALKTFFYSSDFTYPVKEIYERGDRISMADYKDSFNLIIGTTNDTIDWFDNPYI